MVNFMSLKKVGIIGAGYVGQAMLKIFPDALLYDAAPKQGITLATKEEINRECELAIICVPTPAKQEEQEFKQADISIVEECVQWLETPLILIKSTVPPGTTDELALKYKKDICFSPEYVGEGKYQITPWKYMSPDDPRLHDFLIIGGKKDIRERVANIFLRRLGPEKFYYLIEATEAEIVKYMDNAWGALKVIFTNEFYQLCQAYGASYTRVREGLLLDNRIERMHTAVFTDDQGVTGKCYPKDLNGIVAAADKKGVDMHLLKSALRKNKEIIKT